MSSETSKYRIQARGADYNTERPLESGLKITSTLVEFSRPDQDSNTDFTECT